MVGWDVMGEEGKGKVERENSSARGGKMKQVSAAVRQRAAQVCTKLGLR